MNAHRIIGICGFFRYRPLLRERIDVIGIVLSVSANPYVHSTSALLNIRQQIEQRYLDIRPVCIGQSDRENSTGPLETCEFVPTS